MDISPPDFVPEKNILPAAMNSIAILKNDNIWDMDTMQIDILNPKANKLLEDPADLKLISIRKSSDDGLPALVNKFRKKAKNKPPTLAEITKEVEIVRAARYTKSKR